MDTIIIGHGLPGVLAFFDESPSRMIDLWQGWIDTDSTIRATHTAPGRDAVVLLRPASIGTVQFVPNDPSGRLMSDRMLWSYPHLQERFDSADLPPEEKAYWTLQFVGFGAKVIDLPGGGHSIELSSWDFARI